MILQVIKKVYFFLVTSQICEKASAGLGMDWGVGFNNGGFSSFQNDEATKELQNDIQEHQESRSSWKDEMHTAKTQVKNDQSCQFDEKSLVTKTGSCSASGSCHIAQNDYYGSSCEWLEEGALCQVEMYQYADIDGWCSEGGHCKGPQGQVRFHHEACAGRRGNDHSNHEKIFKVKQFLRNANQDQNSTIARSNPKSNSEPSECRGLYNPSAYKKLELICTDCYNLFKESEVFNFCMSGCFESPFFMTCVRSLMMEEDMVMELVKLVGK